MNCTASIKACEDAIKAGAVEKDQTSTFAEEGTKAHEYGEKLLLKTVKEQDIPKDFRAYVLEYRDYCLTQMSENSELYVEQKLSYERWVENGFGTGDCIIYDPKTKTIKIIDLKYGKGIQVNAYKNSQLMLYGLAALEAFDFMFDIELVELHVAQPRLAHFDCYSLDVKELLEFGELVKSKAEQIKNEDNLVFKTGDWCTFCPMRVICTKRNEERLEQARLEFGEYEPTHITKFDDKELGEIFRHKSKIESWLKDIGEYIRTKLLKHGEYPGFKMVEGRSKRNWNMEDFQVAQKLYEFGVEKEDIFKKSIVTVPQAEKLLGKKHEGLTELYKKDAGSPTVVHESDKRPALKIGAVNEFQKLDEEY
jgi:hypothetical protein